MLYTVRIWKEATPSVKKEFPVQAEGPKLAGDVCMAYARMGYHVDVYEQDCDKLVAEYIRYLDGNSRAGGGVLVPRKPGVTVPWHIRHLNVGNQYSLGVACAGPGIGAANTLKHLVTGRIRRCAYNVNYIFAASVREPADNVDWLAAKRGIRKLATADRFTHEAMDHWATHSIAGLQILKAHEVMPDEEVTLLIRLCIEIKRLCNGLDDKFVELTAALETLKEYYGQL